MVESCLDKMFIPFVVECSQVFVEGLNVDMAQTIRTFGHSVESVHKTINL